MAECIDTPASAGGFSLATSHYSGFGRRPQGVAITLALASVKEGTLPTGGGENKQNLRDGFFFPSHPLRCAKLSYLLIINVISDAAERFEFSHF